MNNQQLFDHQKLDLFYGRKLSIAKKAAILSRIAIVAQIRMTRNEKRNNNLLSLWVARYWKYIEPYLKEFCFYFNNGNIPEGMFCIFRCNDGIGIYETPIFHQQYLEASQKPRTNRKAVFVKPDLNLFSITSLLNHPISI